MKKLLTILLFTIVCFTSRAKSDIGLTQDYGNVRVLSRQHGDLEVFRKAFIIGQLTEKLADKLQYTDPIYLDFRYNLFGKGSTPPIYHLSIESLKYDNEDGNESEKLIIRQYANDYDITNTLKLIEYAILNKSSIRKSQKEKSNSIKNGTRKFLSVDDEEIASLLRSSTTDVVAKVMQIRVDRPILPEERKGTISYYWQNNQYHMFRNTNLRSETENKEVELFPLSNIYQLVDLSLVFLIFDSPESFYYTNMNLYRRQGGISNVSRHHIIEDMGEVDWGKTVTRISDEDVAIFFTHGSLGWGKKRMLLYFYDTNTLVQDVYAATGISYIEAKLHSGYKQIR